MAVKSIVDIEVNDDAFKKFTASFTKYQEQLKQTAPAWAAVDESSKSVGITAAEMTALMLAQIEVMREMIPAHEKAAKQTVVQSNAWTNIARQSRSFARHIADATKSILRWGEITGLISGIVGAGGLFGIERLAVAGGSMRRASLGTNSPVGDMRSFGVNYSRIVNPDQFLGGVNTAMHDVTQRVGLYGAGLGEGDIAGHSTTDVAAQLIPALKRIADSTQDSMMQQVLTARHLDQFVSLEDFQRLKATPQAEIDQYGRSFQRDRKTLDLTQDQQRLWQDLNVQLHRAGEQIETVFIRALTPLAPQIGKLSDSFVHLIEKIGSSSVVKRWMDAFAEGLQWFADNLDSPAFQNKITEGLNAIDRFTQGLFHGIGWLADKFPAIFGSSTGGSTMSNGVAPTAHPGMFGMTQDLWYGYGNGNSGGMNDWPGMGHGISDPVRGFQPFSVTGTPQARQYSNSPTSYGAPDSSTANRWTPAQLAANDHQFGLPVGTSASIYGIESASGANPSTSATGAMGPFQFMPGTWHDYGQGGNVQSIGDAGPAMGRYFSFLLHHFNGDRAKAAAGYNAGEGNVDRAVSQWGTHWLEHMRRETQDYVPRYLRETGTGQIASNGVNIRIYNNTGGSAVVTASQVG